ncbi:unnamed protein product [Ambrosiozyma monospora]|uniref:Unnamed protein product n=1 Tax=Ambrosiozyma monospora TaxID=43982 RepID=A0ACB5SZ34_AMBMO|nr:unnamed protein product [Ambrosiozyma monospora]
MNRSEVKQTSVVKLSPIKNAVKSLLEKNGELSTLEFWIKRSLKEGIDPKTIANATHFNNLSRILAGTVDSPVNGGVGQYRVFLNGVISDDPEYDNDVMYLKNCFDNLIRLLNNLLKLHEALVPANLKPQHEVMVELFQKNFKAEIEDLKLDTKSVLKLDEMVQALISANIRNHRNQHRMLGSNYASSSTDMQSSSALSNPNSSTANFLANRDDDTSSLMGSNTSGSIHNSIHSASSGSKMSSALSSFSGRPGSTAGWSATGSQYGGKRTVLNYK